MSEIPSHPQLRSELPTSVLNASSAGAAVAPAPTTASLAALLTGHLLQDGEIIVLILKPSVLFIILSALRWAAAAVIFMLAGVVFDEQLPGKARTYAEIGSIVLVTRLVWSLLQWMSRLYILTDLRIIRLGGVLRLFIYSVPLRKIAQTRILYTMRERCCRVGTIEIIPSDEEYAIGMWQMVDRPVAINEQIVAAITKAKQGRSGSNGI